jgi:hypothetical protein
MVSDGTVKVLPFFRYVKPKRDELGINFKIANETALEFWRSRRIALSLDEFLAQQELPG